MKKRIIAIALSLLSCIFCLFGAACDDDKKSTQNKQQFGQFSYNGKYLKEYATKDISADQAKEIVQSNKEPIISLGVNPSDTKQPLPSDSLVDSVITKYGTLQIDTIYYVTGSDKKQTKTDFLQGTDFKSVIEQNQFIPFSQLVARGVIIFDELIDYMEEQNEIFQESEVSKIAPFKTIFSYHTDKSGNIVIHTRDFAEIPSSVGGGIGCSYRQDTEIVYDSENKLTKWQTSLGVYSATPKGTLQQGYILEVNLYWSEKDE